MRNYLQFFGSSFIMSLFWLLIYLFGNQIMAAYLSVIFGLIAILILSWLLFRFLILLRVQSKKELENIRKRELAENVILKKS